MYARQIRVEGERELNIPPAIPMKEVYVRNYADPLPSLRPGERVEGRLASPYFLAVNPFIQSSCIF